MLHLDKQVYPSPHFFGMDQDMKNKILLLVVLLSLLLAACGGKAAPSGATAVSSTSVSSTSVSSTAVGSTSDPCSTENVKDAVTKVNDLMRQFDDYSLVAQNTPQAQLTQVIPPIQKVLRDAEDQKVPACLENLKKFQLGHMNAVIQTLLVLLANPQPNKNAVAAIQAGIAQARDLHHQYDIEYARLLGITLVAPPTNTTPSGTPGASAPGAAAPFTVTNMDTSAVVLVASPNATAGGVATLDAGLTALAFGQTADGKWIQVEVPGQPGQKAWVDATLVKASGTLPVVTP
jgi:hypothetical protein